MESAVYLLCAATALACAALLLRGFRRSRARLLFWAGLCFLALAAENVVLFIDLVWLPEVDLSLVRLSVGLAGMAMLLYALVWEVR